MATASTWVGAEPVRRRIIETKAYMEDAKNLADITT
jgi:hypothetical protein